MSMQDVVGAHRHSSNHRAELKESFQCGCFYCLHIFEPMAIVEWVDVPDGKDLDAGNTAIYPYCGVDSVIGSASGFPITAPLLLAMQARWFGFNTGTILSSEKNEHGNLPML